MSNFLTRICVFTSIMLFSSILRPSIANDPLLDGAILEGRKDWNLENKSERDDSLMKALNLQEERFLIPSVDANFPTVQQIVKIESLDGLEIVAAYTHTPVQMDAPLMIIVHSIAEDRNSYRGFAEFLRENGISTLVFDLRGYGESTKKRDGSAILAESFQNDSASTIYRDMEVDVKAVVDWVVENNLADTQGIFLLGSETGASVAGLAGIRNSSNLEGLLLISPIIVSRQINLSEAMMGIQGLPIMVMVAEDDSLRGPVGETLRRKNTDARPVRVPGANSGLRLLGEPVPREKILEFVERYSAGNDS